MAPRACVLGWSEPLVLGVWTRQKCTSAGVGVAGEHPSLRPRGLVSAPTMPHEVVRKLCTHFVSAPLSLTISSWNFIFNEVS